MSTLEPTIDVLSPVRYSSVRHPRGAAEPGLEAAAAPATAPSSALSAAQPARGPRRWTRWVARGGEAIGWTVLIVAALVMVVPTLLGFDRYVIVSGSMHPVLDRGSVVYSKPVPTEELEVGDVITYLPPVESGVGHLVTHRIATITKDAEGARVFRTKGDANPGMDPWVFQLDTAEQNTMRFHLPVLGYALIWLANPHLRIYVIGIPAAVIALQALLELLGVEPRLPRRRGRSSVASA